MKSSEMDQLHLIAAVLFTFILGANAFSYKEAKNWGKKYSECNGKNQSPIAFRLPGVFGYPDIKQTLKLKDFKKLPTKMTIQNTGHTVEMKADWSGKPPRCTGGPLHGSYVFEKTTFHWAPKKVSDAVDYDNAIAGQFLHDMEMHMFFYKTDFKSFEKAQTQKGGLAVFTMWLRNGDDNPEHLFENLDKNLHKVRSINTAVDIPPFRFASIFDNGFSPFLFYEGSLDYPPCSESVTWFIDDVGSAVTGSLLNGLRKIKLANGDVSNVRPPQALNNREIKNVSTFKIEKE